MPAFNWRRGFTNSDVALAADRLLDLLEEKYKLLADNPHMGPARPDIAKELRYHPVGNYLLLYRIISGGIELVRVVHGARDLQSLF
jgi:toxin ParE1/3/4